MILAQLSDPHIVATGKLFRCPMQGTAPDAERASFEFDTAPYLARAVASLNALVPRTDVTVVTGDLVDHGEPNEYEQLRHLLAPLSMPVFVIPGNHDAREPLREAFRDARYHRIASRRPRGRYEIILTASTFGAQCLGFAGKVWSRSRFNSR
jgi:3',5'-cyclic AMP phosphodiesterase CpdA